MEDREGGFAEGLHVSVREGGEDGRLLRRGRPREPEAALEVKYSSGGEPAPELQAANVKRSRICKGNQK